MKETRKYKLLSIILAIVLLILFFRPVGIKKYKDTIQTHNDSIEAINTLRENIQIELSLNKDSLKSSEAKEMMYEDSIKTLCANHIADTKKRRLKHENEIANITSISIDSLYLLVTDRLGE